MAASLSVPVVRLKRGSAKPLHAGHPWVFSGGIATVDGAARPGDEVRVLDEGGTCLGRGFFSPDSAIAVRLISRADAPVTPAVLAGRIDDALRLRRDVLKLGDAPLEAAPAPQLLAKDQALLDSLDQQLAKIQSFAAQYGMDAGEETLALRKRREELLKDAGAASASVPAPVSTAAPTTAYRLINSEGDGLGGLIVDVYGGCLAVQAGTVGIEKRLEDILDILEDRLHPQAIMDRSDARTRQLEKLPPPRSGALRGREPDGPHVVTEHGIPFHCDLRSGFGQKTGLYLDQRENRRFAASLARGRDVLDAFCYSGGFSLHAAHAGAKSVTLADSSAEALEMARKNLELNRIDDADLIEAEWPEAFKHLRENGRQFNLIVLDPPKFAPAREHLNRALSGYRDLNAQAVRLLAPGGLLFTCSCSGSVPEVDFERAVAAGLHSAGRRAVLLERRGAGPDHPIPPGFDQGKYLKALLLQVV